MRREAACGGAGRRSHRALRSCGATSLRLRVRSAEARTAYESALTKLAALAKDDEARQRSGYKDVLEAKRDALGGAK
jgi:hypothetical protein